MTGNRSSSIAFTCCHYHLLQYLRKNFDFGHVGEAKVGDSMHFHAYQFAEQEGRYNIEMAVRLSTGAEGVAVCLGLKAEPRVEFTKIVMEVEKKLSPETLVTI